MKKYRIVEETGKLTGKTRFYIERQYKKLSGKKAWKIVYHRVPPDALSRILEFDDLIKAMEWVHYKTENVSVKIHDMEEITKAVKTTKT